MIFTTKDKLKALAIVNIFETGRPFGDYAACVVLNDGAGISYGAAQFTHRSGSLLAVVERYLQTNATAGRAVLLANLPFLRQTSPLAINALAKNAELKNALRKAASTVEMRVAQVSVAIDRYLRPALNYCAAARFTAPLSLAVVYDSIVHGSFVRVARSIRASSANEQAWITEYVRRRDAWLASIPRLASTRYRTRFFLNQIAISNWELRMPVRVQGVSLTDNILNFSAPAAVEPKIIDPLPEPKQELPQFPAASSHSVPQAQPPLADRPTTYERISETLTNATAELDRVDRVADVVTRRSDAAKSLWATIAGTLWQAAWAVFGFAAGLPRLVWITVAAIAGVLVLAYIYRQITLGRIREQKI